MTTPARLLPQALFTFDLRFGAPFRLHLRDDEDGQILQVEPRVPEPLSPEDQELYDLLMAPSKA